MSRRAGNERAAENQQTIKNLLKLDGNKVCADCKKNKHPRWASWNIGVFVCIRCSGIHRGMGTHISRVKSVDLDAWTDQQLQSVLNWGNARANKYWEAKLATGHVPSESKIENFIRTKYESKRWVTEGPIPDPSTLDADGDDDVPLNLVQEKAKIERSASEKKRAAPTHLQSQQRVAPTIDLFGDDIPPPPVPPGNTKPAIQAPQPKIAAPAVSQPKKQGDSLLGLDLFGNTGPAGPARPASASSNPTGLSSMSRPDLKQSILSLYSSSPKTQLPSSHTSQPSLSSMSALPTQPQDAFGGLANSLTGLDFSDSKSKTTAYLPSAKIATPSMPAKSTPSAPQLSAPPPLSGGSFFDPPRSVVQNQPTTIPAQSQKPFGDLNWAIDPSPNPPRTNVPASGDLFADDDFSGFSQPDPPPVQPPPRTSSSLTSSNHHSAFNLTAPAASTAKPPPPAPPRQGRQNSIGMLDPWSSAGDSNAWSTAEATAVPSRPKAPSVDIGRPPAHITPNDISSGWGESTSSTRKNAQASSITADEDYGGWTSSVTRQKPTSAAPKPNATFGNTSDPFANPWG